MNARPVQIYFRLIPALVLFCGVLSAQSPPVITKVFSAIAIPPGGTAALTFTITNLNVALTLTGVSFSDTLPAGLLVSTPNGLTGSCSGGTISASAGSNIVSLSTATILASGSCTFSVNVTATSAGTLTNTTSSVTSDQTVAGNTASASIIVGRVLEVSYASNLIYGDSFITLSNTGENDTGSGPLGVVNGNICVSVYAFAPDEQLIACCSCLVTPNGLNSLSVQNDVIANALTGVKPGAVVLKLLSTLAGNGTATSCSGAAAPGMPAAGLAAWRTTLHALPTAGAFAVTERPFSPIALTANQLSTLTSQCGTIVANGSGSGICGSCRTGSL